MAESVTFVTPFYVNIVGDESGPYWPTKPGENPIKPEHMEHCFRVGVTIERMRHVFTPRGYFCGEYTTSDPEEIAVMMGVPNCKALSRPKKVEKVKPLPPKPSIPRHDANEPPTDYKGEPKWELCDPVRLQKVCVEYKIAPADRRLKFDEQRRIVKERWREKHSK